MTSSVIYKGKEFPVNYSNKSLNLSDQGISNIEEIENLNKLTYLEELILPNNDITEIKGLDELINLKNLNLNSNNITETKGLQCLIRLEELRLEDNHIIEIKRLNLMNNLNRLYLGQNEIKRIKGLDKLSNLQQLYIPENKISEIKGLTNLRNLKVLDLGNNPIKELKGLDNLQVLEKLGLSNTEIKIELLEKLGGFHSESPKFVLYPQNFVKYCRNEYVEYEGKPYFIKNNQLYLASLGITDLNEIKKIENIMGIEFLSLVDNKIKDITAITNLKNLKTLWLTLNEIEEIENVKGLVGLESLSLNENYIKTISGLKSLKNLKELNLEKNNLQDLNGLEELKKLEILNLANNPDIKDFSVLENLIFLRILNLYNINIKDISILEYMENLEELILNNNNITEIPEIKTPSLKIIDLSNNNLKSMENLCQFQNLEKLNLNKNYISELKCIDKMYRLKKFYIKENLIDKDLYSKLFISDNPNFPNNSKYFILYVLFSNFFHSFSNLDQKDLNFNEIIKNHPILLNKFNINDYPKIRDILHLFKKEFEIRCGPNNIPLSIITPKVIASEIDDLLRPVGLDKGYSLDHVVNQLQLCNKDALKRLLNYIKINNFYKIPFYVTEKELKRASDTNKLSKKNISPPKNDFVSTIKDKLININYVFIGDMKLEGESGKLYKINSIVDDKTRVLKIYKDPINEENRKHLIEDIKKLKKYKHENIIKAYDTGYIDFENETYFYVILEYIDGISFDKIKPHIFRENNTYDDRKALFIEVLKTIEVFRRQYELHNDLHSGNLMLIEKEGFKKIKIIDFGKSKDAYSPAKPDYDLYMLKNDILPIFFNSEELESFSLKKIEESSDFNKFKHIFVIEDFNIEENEEKSRIKDILKQCYDGIKKICDFHYQKLEHSRNSDIKITLNDNEVFLSAKKIEENKDICLKYLDIYYEAKDEAIKRIGNSYFEIICKDLTIMVWLKNGRFPINSFYLLESGKKDHMEKSRVYTILSEIKKNLDNL